MYHSTHYTACGSTCFTKMAEIIHSLINITQIKVNANVLFTFNELATIRYIG